jgi:riboflavin kinase / FMN adenylyltransferase
MTKVSGVVMKGKQLGRELGFPTANIKAKLILDSGVYIGEVILDNQKYKAAIFIPQIENFVEAHILNFSSDIYGKKIEIIIGKKIREVRKFENDDELKNQIKKDLKICLLE